MCCHRDRRWGWRRWQEPGPTSLRSGGFVFRAQTTLGACEPEHVPMSLPQPRSWGPASTAPELMPLLAPL